MNVGKVGFFQLRTFNRRANSAVADLYGYSLVLAS